MFHTIEPQKFSYLAEDSPCLLSLLHFNILLLMDPRAREGFRDEQHPNRYIGTTKVWTFKLLADRSPDIMLDFVEKITPKTNWSYMKNSSTCVISILVWNFLNSIKLLGPNSINWYKSTFLCLIFMLHCIMCIRVCSTLATHKGTYWHEKIVTLETIQPKSS